MLFRSQMSLEVTGGQKRSTEVNIGNGFQRCNFLYIFGINNMMISKNVIDYVILTREVVRDNFNIDLKKIESNNSPAKI